MTIHLTSFEPGCWNEMRNLRMAENYYKGESVLTDSVVHEQDKFLLILLFFLHLLQMQTKLLISFVFLTRILTIPDDYNMKTSNKTEIFC
jgi:hypothetical protein